MAARHLGPTFDEPFYISAGLTRWHTGSHKGLVSVGTMPLPADVATVSIYLWESFNGVTLDPVEDLEVLLPWARAGTLVFWWILLWYGWRSGRELAGPWGGRLAVAFLACEPCLLGHASLATTDIAVSACLLALVYHFRTERDSGWLRRVGLVSFWYGAAIAAKASALLFGPLCLGIVELERLARAGVFRSVVGQPEGPGHFWKTKVRARLGQMPALLSDSARDLLQIFGLGLLIVSIYCSDGRHPTRHLNAADLGLPEGPASRIGIWLVEHLRSPENAYRGLSIQFKHNAEHGGTYLLGESHRSSVWYYFPVALSIKLSLPLLIITILLACRNPRALLNWACLSAAGLLVFSPLYRVQIGVRFVLPLVALGVVGLAAGLIRTWNASTVSWTRTALAGGVGVGIFWTAAAAMAVWPDGLCYTNALWGGTDHGYRYLSDSNYDWGQGLKELTRWQRRRGIDWVNVWYFGTDPALKKLNLRIVPLDTVAVHGPEDFLVRMRGPYLAASTTMLYGMTSTAPAAVFLRQCQPVARTSTFFIYELQRRPDDL
jgi:hypothetical protein